jgi:hypothetical protein
MERRAMVRKRAVVEEFTVGENEVKHGPTSATFYAYPGREEIHQHRIGHLEACCRTVKTTRLTACG